jgi:hypothetical protein
MSTSQGLTDIADTINKDSKGDDEKPEAGDKEDKKED